MSDNLLEAVVIFKWQKVHGKSSSQLVEGTYNRQVEERYITTNAAFNYGFGLIQRPNCGDIQKGIHILSSLYENGNEEHKDLILLLAIGYTKIKEYKTALNYVNAYKEADPSNKQIHSIEKAIKNQMSQDSLKRMTITGASVLFLGGLVSMGMALLKK